MGNEVVFFRFEDDGIPLDEDSNCNLFQLAIALNKPAKLRILLHVYESK